MITYTTSSADETEQLAANIASKLRSGDVLAFRGGLGAGKTAFTRGLARGLGVIDDVSSPTFAIINEYRGTGMTLYHFDMYRITDYDGLYSTGFFDYLDSGGVLAIEWSENIEAVLPEHTITITITPTGEHTRQITVQGGDRF